MPLQKIHFPKGVVAFEDIKDFTLLNHPDPELPFKWLQSIEDPDLAFVVMDPFLFMPEYEVNLPADVEQRLELKSPEEVLLLTIVVVPTDVENTRTNLAAPLVINIRTKKGEQMVLNDPRYTTKHFIFQKSCKEAESHADPRP